MHHRNSHTVCGHEAMHLAQRLNEELAQQSQSGRTYGSCRAVSPDSEPRSRSYENKQNKGKGKKHIILKYTLILTTTPKRDVVSNICMSFLTFH